MAVYSFSFARTFMKVPVVARRRLTTDVGQSRDALLEVQKECGRETKKKIEDRR